MTRTTRTGIVVAAAGAALLTVYFVRGAPRVDSVSPTSRNLPAPGDTARVAKAGAPAIARPQPTVAPSQPAPPERSPAPRAAASPLRSTSPPIQPPAVEPGSLDKDTIRTGIRAMLPKIQECYSNGLESNPNLRGRIVFNFVIRTKNGKGRIDEGEIDPEKDELQAPMVEQCMLGALAQTSFPAPEGGGEVHVSYPFMLESQ